MYLLKYLIGFLGPSTDVSLKTPYEFSGNLDRCISQSLLSVSNEPR